MESWRSVAGWPYEVSSMGRVRRSGRASGTRPGLVLKHQPTREGYVRVALSISGRQQKFLVHLLVLEAFTERPYEHAVANHKNGNKADPRLSNLEWTTRSENQLHAYDTGLQKAGSRHGRAKLTEEQVVEIRKRYAAGESQTALAREYPVNQSMISKIVREEFWMRTTT